MNLEFLKPNKNENIKGESEATNAHFNVRKIVREAISKIGGTIPEDFQTPNKSIKQLEKEQKQIK